MKWDNLYHGAEMKKCLLFLLALGFTSNAFSQLRKPENFENVPVWRIRLEVKTDTKKNANTDSSINVRLNNNMGTYWLDRGGDDREKGRTDVYHIVTEKVKKISDIKYLKLTTSGKDGWCVKSIALKINNIETPVYKKTFSNCHWIDRDSGHAPVYNINSSTLRRYAQFKWTSQNRNIWLPPFNIPRSTLEGLVEGVMGNEIHSIKNLDWGKKGGRAYVEAKKGSGTRTVHFDLDFKYKLKRWFDPSVDVDFDLVFSCVSNKIKLEAKKVKVKIKGNRVLNWLTLGLQKAIFKVAQNKIKIDDRILGQVNAGFCPRVIIENDGGVRFTL